MTELPFPVQSPAPPGETPGLDYGFANETAFHFRGFRVGVGSRVLHRDGAALELGSRAFDLLVVLLRERGTVLSKRRIMEAVWPSTIVDESNLRFQMACLRRILGADRDVIKTIQGRGYLFVPDTVRVLEARPAGAKEPRDQGPPRAPREGPATIAVVEDDESTREALDGLLRSSGFLVETYPSSQALLDAGLSNLAECLVVDVWLPGRSGLDFQDDLKAAGVDVPIVFISGHADIPMSVRAIKAGAVEFLTKPVRHQELMAAIQAAVAMGRERP